VATFVLAPVILVSRALVGDPPPSIPGDPFRWAEDDGRSHIRIFEDDPAALIEP
jgi:hypothetical protein